MLQVSPLEVKRAVSDDLRDHWHLSRQEASDILGYANKQSFNNLMAKNEYFSPRIARRMNSYFGYSELFLTEGKGDMFTYSEVIRYDDDHRDMFAADLMTKLYEWSALYGANNVRTFLGMLSTLMSLHELRVGQDKDPNETTLMDGLRQIYNMMMYNCRDMRPFIGLHPQKTPSQIGRFLGQVFFGEGQGNSRQDHPAESVDSSTSSDTY